jgi:Tfp pilus assembly protein PilO
VYFIPRNNWLYAFLVARQRWQWACLTVAAAALIVAAWWMAGMIPLQRRVAHVQQEYELLSNKQHLFTQLSHEVSVFESQIAVLQNELRNVLGSSSAGYKRLLNSLLIHVVESGLALDNCSLKVPESRTLNGKPWCITHPVELAVSGSFAQLHTLFARLGAQRSPIFINSFCIERTSDGKLGALITFLLQEVADA